MSSNEMIVGGCDEEFNTDSVMLQWDRGLAGNAECYEIEQISVES
jgi:hypothetical protein